MRVVSQNESLSPPHGRLSCLDRRPDCEFKVTRHARRCHTPPQGEGGGRAARLPARMASSAAEAAVSSGMSTTSAGAAGPPLAVLPAEGPAEAWAPAARRTGRESCLGPLAPRA